MPETNVLTTSFFLFIIFSRENFTSPTSIPKLSERLIFSKASILLTSAFVGIHPWFRQVPPSLFSSIMITFFPPWAALMAAT
ncbi:hypothetical protein SDC9_54860 [bioreactor metagenome]|uniref:Uncharacterized protein n=1 Tax=bioreactor metagenome TaxID=1076179 RepID=A0A644WXW5_9ZZZZ